LQIVKAVWPGVVTEETFNKVQERLSKNKNRYKPDTNVLFFENGTKIANLVRHYPKGMTSGTEEKSEKSVFA
jgi:hypothetical protein